VEWNHPEPANQSIINQVKALVRSLSIKLSALFCVCVFVCGPKDEDDDLAMI
jgi:hypothetical protein